MKKAPACKREPFFVLKTILHFFNAFGANVLAFEIFNILCLSTENTCGLILFQDYMRSFNKYLQGIPLRNIHCSSKFDRNYHSSKLINFSYNTCRFHLYPSLCRDTTIFDNHHSLNATNISIISQPFFVNFQSFNLMLKAYILFLETPVSSITNLTASLFLIPR